MRRTQKCQSNLCSPLEKCDQLNHVVYVLRRSLVHSCACLSFSFLFVGWEKPFAIALWPAQSIFDFATGRAHVRGSNVFAARKSTQARDTNINLNFRHLFFKILPLLSRSTTLKLNRHVSQRYSTTDGFHANGSRSQGK